MNLPETLSLSRAELESFLEALREAKHDVSNSLAVFMALAELSERNPANLERLAKVVLERSPKVVSDLNTLQEHFRRLLENCSSLVSEATPPL